QALRQGEHLLVRKVVFRFKHEDVMWFRAKLRQDTKEAKGDRQITSARLCGGRHLRLGQLLTRERRNVATFVQEFKQRCLIVPADHFHNVIYVVPVKSGRGSEKNEIVFSRL